MPISFQDLVKSGGQVTAAAEAPLEQSSAPRFDDLVKAGGEVHEKPGVLEAGARGLAQGATLGFADELTGGAEALIDKLGGSDRELADLYQRHRDESRAAYHEAEATHPYISAAGNFAGAIASTALTGGTGVGVKGAAALGALAGAGSSEADNLGELVGDTVKGGAIGGVSAGVAKYVAGKFGLGLQKVNGYAAGQVADADARAAQLAAKDVEGTVGTARGALGGEVQKGNRLVENLMRLQDDMTPEQAKAFRALERSGSLDELKQRLIDSSLKDLPGQTETIGNRQQAFQDILASKDSAIAAAKDRILSPEGVKDQVLARAKRYGVPLAGSIIGTAVGGPIGGALGALAGAGTRPAARSIANLVTKYPGVQKTLWGTVQRLTATQPEVLGEYAQKLAPAIARGEQSFAAAHYVLSQRDPGYRELIRRLGDEGALAQEDAP